MIYIYVMAINQLQIDNYRHLIIHCKNIQSLAGQISSRRFAVQLQLFLSKQLHEVAICYIKIYYIILFRNIALINKQKSNCLEDAISNCHTNLIKECALLLCLKMEMLIRMQFFSCKFVIYTFFVTIHIPQITLGTLTVQWYSVTCYFHFQYTTPLRTC